LVFCGFGGGWGGGGFLVLLGGVVLCVCGVWLGGGWCLVVGVVGGGGEGIQVISSNLANKIRRGEYIF